MRTNIYVAYAFAIAASITFASSTIAQDVVDRYPDRLPDWLWDRASNAHLLSSADVLTLRSDISKLIALRKLSDTSSADLLESDITRRIASRFSLRDVTAGAVIVKHAASGISLAVQLDPAFDAQTKETLLSAVSQFIEVALDPKLIKKAFERSTQVPSPMPAMFEVKDGKPQVDEVGRPVFTAKYALYLKSVARPANPRQFSNHLRNALTNANEEPAVLVISRYSGGKWWGETYYGYFSNPDQQLARIVPASGYFYISLNGDKLTSPALGWNDPSFWASKIAHEMLHNLGYWHPVYSDPIDRDAHNQGNNWAFTVSYEAAVLEQLKAIK